MTPIGQLHRVPELGPVHHTRLARRVSPERPAQLAEHFVMSAYVHSFPDQRGSVAAAASLLDGVAAAHTLPEQGNLELRKVAVGWVHDGSFRRFPRGSCVTRIRVG